MAGDDDAVVAGDAACSGANVCSDPLPTCVALIQAHGGVHLRELRLFGSRASATHSAASDVDLLMVIEPSDAAWGPEDNVTERRRIERLVQPQCAVRVDLWVRTIDQLEEARSVIGGVEYLAASRGVTVYARPWGRRPIVRRSPEAIRCRNVCDLLQDSRRVLGQAVRGEMNIPASAMAGRCPEHYAWRAIQHAVCAVFASWQVDTPEKADDLATMLSKIEHAERGRTARFGALARAHTPSAAIARDVLREIVAYLASEPALRAALQPLAHSLSWPLYRLAAAAALKA